MAVRSRPAAMGPATAAVAPAATSLITELQTGGRRAAVTFAGQGGAALSELSTLVAQRPELRDGLALAAAVLADAAASPAGQASGRFRHGVELVAWADDPAAAPADAYLRSSAISYPLILTTQALLWRAVWQDGLARRAAGRRDRRRRRALDGSAVRAARRRGRGRRDRRRAARPLRAPRLDGRNPRRARRARWRRAAAGDDLGRSPGAADTAAGRRQRAGRPRRERLDRARQRAAPDRRRRSAADARACCARGWPSRRGCEASERQRGQRGGAPLRFGWSALDVDVAFHTPALREPCALLRAQLAAEPGLLPDPAALALPVLSPADGQDLRASGDLAAAVATAQLVAPVRWDVVSRRLADAGADWVLDLGPGTDVARADGREPARPRRAHARARLAGGPPPAQRSPAPRRPGRDVRYASFAPAVVELADGRRHLDGRYARRTGRPPVILAGMTPTTSRRADRRRGGERRLHAPSWPAAASPTAGRSSAASPSCASCSSPAARSSSTRSCSTAICGSCTSLATGS